MGGANAPGDGFGCDDEDADEYVFSDIPLIYPRTLLRFLVGLLGFLVVAVALGVLGEEAGG